VPSIPKSQAGDKPCDSTANKNPSQSFINKFQDRASIERPQQ